jgi:hypothetical protein
VVLAVLAVVTLVEAIRTWPAGCTSRRGRAR